MNNSNTISEDKVDLVTSNNYSLNTENSTTAVHQDADEDPNEIQKQIMRQLVTLNARQKEQGEYLHTIMLIVSSIQDNQKNQMVPSSLGSNQQFEKIYEMLPISTNDELNIFKKALTEDNTIYDQTVNMLSKIGGDNYKQAVRRILKKLITDEYAKSYSYTGHKGNKMPFNKTILSSLLTKATQSSSIFNQNSAKDVEGAASIWLSKASERLKINTTNNFNI
ncbi:unnamed protein product [Aphis gossypii]|uniref:DUF4806 domain-containing protein n=1 Tax=Aphis gossypii TaxID=80765 RepID=A0A9P0IUL2_APHGO|nr:unnamed protein product [Aphis gossypii]